MDVAVVVVATVVAAVEACIIKHIWYSFLKICTFAYFRFYKQFLHNKKCRLQWDSNLDCRSRR